MIFGEAVILLELILRALRAADADEMGLLYMRAWFTAHAQFQFADRRGRLRLEQRFPVRRDRVRQARTPRWVLRKVEAIRS